MRKNNGGLNGPRGSGEYEVGREIRESFSKKVTGPQGPEGVSYVDNWGRMFEREKKQQVQSPCGRSKRSWASRRVMNE